MIVGVGVSEGVGVIEGVNVMVGVSVMVGVKVMVGVNVIVGVSVIVGVFVLVGVLDGVTVLVGVVVRVGVNVDVIVGVLVRGGLGVFVDGGVPAIFKSVMTVRADTDRIVMGSRLRKFTMGVKVVVTVTITLSPRSRGWSSATGQNANVVDMPLLSGPWSYSITISASCKLAIDPRALARTLIPSQSRYKTSPLRFLPEAAP